MRFPNPNNQPDPANRRESLEAAHALGASALQISFNPASHLDPRNRGQEPSQNDNFTLRDTQQRMAEAVVRRGE